MNEQTTGRLAAEFINHMYQLNDRGAVQCSVHDITETKQAEEGIRAANAELEQRIREQNAELQAANEELHAVSYSLSNDLRAPLRHVLGFMQLLQDDAGPALSEKSLHYLTAIAQSAERMGGLIDGLVSYASLNMAEVRPAEIELDQLVLAVLDDVKDQAADRNINWQIHSLPAVRGDRTLLRLVLFQLISNAVKFTSGRAAATIEIGCLPSGGGETVIFIRDNGAGFDPQYAGKLFGVFQRLHNGGEFEGSGMGLVNVQRIIQRHGGRTWAEGTVNQGATIYFSIPNQTQPGCENLNH
ncbi:MAG TPA: ATP-binding protein [Verrucomicrobiae bacterium]